MTRTICVANGHIWTLYRIMGNPGLARGTNFALRV